MPATDELLTPHGADVTNNLLTPDALAVDLQRFLLWTLECLHLPVAASEDGHFELVLTEEEDRQRFSGAGQVAFSFTPRTDVSVKPVEHVTLESPLWRWAIGRLQAAGDVVQATLRAQPAGVHHFAQRLFDRYVVDGGVVRLGGCTLEEHPLLRFTFAASTPDGLRLTHIYANSSGEPVAPDLLDALHVADLAPLPGKPHRLPSEAVKQWRAAVQQLAPPSTNGRVPELLATTVVWCKYAQGKLLFAVGGSQAELPFEGWAQLLAEGTVLPPPFRCSVTGRESYHLAATDDGRITVQEAIATCDNSGERVLETDLDVCSWSGRRVLPRYLMECPVTALRILTELAITCDLCRQKVNPQCVQTGLCKSCRSLRPVGKDDALVARVLAEYPKLDGWGGWRISESHRVYILTATSLLRRLLVVLDKDSFEPVRIADGSRFGRRWHDTAKESWKAILGE